MSNLISLDLFDRFNSGLSIPTIERFPNTRGYSFSTWLYIESFHQSDDDSTSQPADQERDKKQVFQPRLFRFMSDPGDDAAGVEAFFHNGKLTLQVVKRLQISL